MSKEKSRKTLATRSVRAGLESDAQHGSVVPPIYLSSNFAFEAYRKPRKYDYSRSGNPTRDQLAVALTDLEGGAGGVVTCTGLAAITLVLATLPQGARVLAPHDCYGGTYRLLAALHAQGKLVADFVDQSDAAALSAALASRPELVWIETPSNPLVRVVDIHAIAQAAHAAGALVAADNTFLSPLWQQPLALGADLVVHSTTKYLNGHSDVVAGMLAGTRQDGFWERLVAIRSGNGGILGTFEAWLLQRGMRTLAIRVERASRTAQQIAEYFSGHRHVAAILYPGLPDFPGHDIACRQMTGGFGGMLSIRVAGGEAAAIATAAAVGLWKRATSLGGVESLIEHRRSVEDAESLCPPDLLRLSVGLEHPEDLIDDLAQALARAHG